MCKTAIKADAEHGRSALVGRAGHVQGRARLRSRSRNHFYTTHSLQFVTWNTRLGRWLCDCWTCVMCNVDRLGRRSERESPKYCDCFQWFLPFVAAEGRLVMGIMGCVGDKVVPYDASAVCFRFLRWWQHGISDMGPWYISQLRGIFFFSFLNVMQIIC